MSTLPIPVFGFGSAEGAQIAGTIGSTLATIAPATGIAAPFVLAAAAAAELVSLAEAVFSGCGATCTEASSIVDQVEPYLQENTENYFSNASRTTVDQAIALTAAQQMFNIVSQNCGNSALGTAGQNCISERLGNGMAQGSDSCAFGLTTADEYPPDSSEAYPVGVCWTWTLAYYTSIQNDVPPGGGVPLFILQALADFGISAGSTILGIPVAYVIIGALVLLGFFFF